MYQELSMRLDEEGSEITLIIDSDTIPYSVSLKVTNSESTILIRDIEPIKFGQFVVNSRRCLSMAHESQVLDEDDEEDEELEEL